MLSIVRKTISQQSMACQGKLETEEIGRWHSGALVFCNNKFAVICFEKEFLKIKKWIIRSFKRNFNL